jgi:hypothetical protein
MRLMTTLKNFKLYLNGGKVDQRGQAVIEAGTKEKKGGLLTTFSRKVILI